MVGVVRDEILVIRTTGVYVLGMVDVDMSLLLLSMLIVGLVDMLVDGLGRAKDTLGRLRQRQTCAKMLER